jgi:hypothetical protein
MAIEYTIDIQRALVTSQEDLTDVVREVEVNVTGKDGNCMFSLPATVKFLQADPEHFIPFENLTQEQLLAWIEESGSLVSVKHHIAYVVAQQVEKAALEQKTLPWQTPLQTPTIILTPSVTEPTDEVPSTAEVTGSTDD